MSVRKVYTCLLSDLTFDKKTSSSVTIFFLSLLQVNWSRYNVTQGKVKKRVRTHNFSKKKKYTIEIKKGQKEEKIASSSSNNDMDYILKIGRGWKKETRRRSKQRTRKMLKVGLWDLQLLFLQVGYNKRKNCCWC